jgi:hypothetical protein
MAHEAENATHDVLTALLGPSLQTPGWLLRPGKRECAERWGLVQEVYHYLTSQQLPDEMPPRETRRVDGVFEYRGSAFIFELDETQHFNGYRATTLRCYPDNLPLAFDKQEWITRSTRKTKLEGGGFAKPRPPLFPKDNGRHQQRAFRDSLADIVPSCHRFLPTLRLGDFEVGRWVYGEDSHDRMAALLEDRLGPHV